MKITWLGHSSFLLESEKGTRVVTDPFEAGSYDGAVGYAPICTTADVVTVSHEHADHNAVGCVEGEPTVVRNPEAVTVKDVKIRGLSTFHDESKGQDRGRNTIYVMDLDGIRVGHLGDLGHILSADDIKTLGDVDVLLAPVGGYYTIGPEEARRTAEALGAKIVIPMHYKTDVLGFPIQPVDDFLKLMPKVERAGSKTIEIERKDLGDSARVIVLNYK
ncbi:MAG: MBL fold metallo-hydrolase [Candidatus Eisenbacteria bacterium]|nr:MBL fold metallo-hydrolase [Candidatus Eisenbacteria bacterium]